MNEIPKHSYGFDFVITSRAFATSVFMLGIKKGTCVVN